MKLNLLKSHIRLVTITLIAIATTLFICLSAGQAKPTSEWEWLDIMGEGGIVVITLLWLFFTLISRPPGRVTLWLVCGLLFMHISMLIDLLDEFLHYPQGQAWMSAIESLPAPIGMLLTSVGLYWWHQEQISLNQQLRRRERLFRHHEFTDYVTGLYSADYMLEQINQELDAGNEFCVLMLDIDKFDQFVSHWGDQQGDRFLRELSELILMNIRLSDLACRYAGDRFILLLPKISEPGAAQIAKQVQQAVRYLAFKPESGPEPVYQSVSISLCHSHNATTAQQVIQSLNQRMLQIKQSNMETVSCAQLV